MCTGQLDVRYLLEAFLRGADGVLVVGCKLGECHYFDGNYQARLKVRAAGSMLERAGIEPARLKMGFLSSAEGGKFAETVRQFVEEVRSLGPTPLLDETRRKRLENNIRALSNAMSEARLRALVGKWRKVVEKGNVYGDKIEETEWRRMLENSIDEEMTRSQILLLLDEKPRSCVELAREMGVEPERALKEITYLRQKNRIDVGRVEGTSPVYQII
jgi:F420-non-reducing hydrogenase iron-sulfur subunit